MAPPSRSARAAVLASSVKRSKSAPYPSRARSTLVRRTVLVVLVLGALTLLTISFRSPTAGALHDLQGAGSTVLRPFQVAATRVARPFRDAYNYLDSLSSVKAENAKLKAEMEQLRAEAVQGAIDKQKYEALLPLLHFQQGSSFPSGYRAVNAAVSSFPSGPFTRAVTIDAGSSSGLTKNTPVVSGDALVGRVSNVFPHTSLVTLLSDPQSFVAARDVHTGVVGLVHPGPGGTLILDEVSKQLVVKKGDVIVTDGTRDPRYPDLYPSGILIGRVVSVNLTDTASFLQVQVQPYADLGSLDAVAALVKTKAHRHK